MLYEQPQQCGCATSEDSDQSGHPPSLIRDFTVCMKKPWVLSYPLSTQGRLIRLDGCPADLSLRWAHSHIVGFVMRRLIFQSFSSNHNNSVLHQLYMDRVKRIWYLSPMRAAKVQASLCICAVSPEPSLLAHTGSESRGTFRQKARSLAPLNG